MAANDMRVLMSLATINRIYDKPLGSADRVDVSLDLDNYDLETESEAIVDDLTLAFADAELAAEIHAGMQPFRDTIVSEIRKFIDEKSGTNELSADNEASLNEFIAELERDEPSERFRVLLAGDAFVGLFFGILSGAELGVVAEGLPQLAFAIGQLERLSASGFKVFLTEIAEQVGNLFFTFFTFFGSFSVIVGLLPDIPDLRPFGVRATTRDGDCSRGGHQAGPPRADVYVRRTRLRDRGRRGRNCGWYRGQSCPRSRNGQRFWYGRRRIFFY